MLLSVALGMGATYNTSHESYSFVEVNGISIAHESVGAPDCETMLQLIDRPMPVVHELVRGWRASMRHHCAARRDGTASRGFTDQPGG